MISNSAEYTIRSIGRSMNITAKFDDGTNPYSPGYYPGMGGGFDRTDSVDINTNLFNTALSAYTAGNATTIYLPNDEQFEQFYNVLYGATLGSRISNLTTQILSAGGKVSDYVVDVFLLPFEYLGYGAYKFNMGFYDVLTDGEGSA